MMLRKKEALLLGSHDGDGGEEGVERQTGEFLLGTNATWVSSAKRGEIRASFPAWMLEEGQEEAGPCVSQEESDAAAEERNCQRRCSKQHRCRGGASLVFPTSAGATVSARKLGADLWGIQGFPVSRMISRKGARAHHLREEQRGELSDLSSLRSYDLTLYPGDVRKHVTALRQNCKSNDKNSHALEPASPASFNSTTEVGASHQASNPVGSLEPKRRSGCSLKTSKELLRVLNRIWSLEEQHASSILLTKSLKLELEHAQLRIQDLLQEKQSDRHEIDILTSQLMENKMVRKNKEQDRIKSAVQSMRDELEDERRMRRRSENLHRKLAKELSEVKTAFLKALRDFEREKVARNLLESLCDELAKGIVEYEQEVRVLHRNSNKVCESRRDRLVLHISEAWLDERLQMKLAESQGNLSEKSTILDRLNGEIEIFLQAMQANKSAADAFVSENMKGNDLHRYSLESIHLNAAIGAPQDAEDGDSVASDSHCFELNMNVGASDSCNALGETGHLNVERSGARKSFIKKKVMGLSERLNCQSSSQFRLDGYAQSYNGVDVQFVNGKQRLHHHSASSSVRDGDYIGASVPEKSGDYESVEDIRGMKTKQGSVHRSNNLMENFTSEAEFSSVCDVQRPMDQKDDLCGHSSWRHSSISMDRKSASGDYRSPSFLGKKWSNHCSSSDLEMSECSSKMQHGAIENSLKAKLLEARLEGRHSRLKPSRGSVGV